jgi:methylenetetrahydrofolate dehydrogenase (NADP+)/methenyltetrahydrofolate cyclohydrolase
MTAKIIDGKIIAEQIYTEIRSDIKLLKEKYDVTPGLAVILVGEDPASVVYVRNKRKMCENLGMHSEEYRMMASTREVEILKLIDDLNHNPSIHGILVQIPLPKGINPIEIQKAISPYKDVDGLNPINVGNLMTGEKCFVPCTPFGVQEMLIRSGIEISGRHVVILGRSNLVGKPLAALLMQKNQHANATVTVCHSKSHNLKDITQQADILIVAIGSPEFVKADMVSEGTVVIDVGMNRVGEKLVGDVQFDSVKEKASYITPVPGGVGRMTIAMLMYNTLKSAKMTVNMV